MHVLTFSCIRTIPPMHTMCSLQRGACVRAAISHCAPISGFVLKYNTFRMKYPPCEKIFTVYALPTAFSLWSWQRNVLSSVMPTSLLLHLIHDI